MKRKIFTILAMILCVCFCFAGCNLFPENKVAKANQTVVSAGGVTITREEFIKGYNSYYSTFYNQYRDSEKATDALIKYLVSKELYLEDAKEMIEKGEITISKTEQNYLWKQTLEAILTNIESFEEDVKKGLGLGEDNSEDEDEEIKQETNFIYTPFDKQAEIKFNKDTNEYEIVVIKEVLISKINEEGQEEFEYVSAEEAGSYNDSNLELYTIEYVYENISLEKLFSEKATLTDEESKAKAISMEALRRYVKQLETNEDGKGLSKNTKEIFAREVERIYEILKDNLLINKLYEQKTKDIKVSEEDVLNLYLSKVQASYDRYLEDPDVFIKELTKTVGSANSMGSYGTPGNCVEDVFYIPEDMEENFFFVTHIVINLTDVQIQKINELKQRCEAEGKDEEYYKTELYKIIPDMSENVISKVIDLQFKLEDETITEQQYNEKLLEIIGEKLLMVDERDDEGYVTKDSKTIQEMVASLYIELDEIYVKYYGEKGNPITLNGHNYTPTENGIIVSEKNGENNKLKLEQLEIDYQNERADKFNEYIYKYSKDTGTLQIQTSYFGTTSENWYLYAMGDGETDNSFVENFVEVARDLFKNGEVTAYKTFLMENWQTSNGVETLSSQSTAYSTMMYAGQINNLFESFNDQKFTLADLLAEETANGNAKYYSLQKMDQYRLGLTMNKTLFDLVFEEYYQTMYNEAIQVYEDETLKDLNLKPNKSVIKDLIG